MLTYRLPARVPCAASAAATRVVAGRVLLVLLLVVWLVAAPSRAQTALQADAAIELQRERLDQQRRALQAASPLQGGRQVAPLASPVAGETPCFVVRQVVVDEVAPPAPAHLTSRLGAFEGACLGAQGIDNLRQLLQQRLVDAGWVTSRISVPMQSLADGVLRLQLHWGRLEAVQVAAPATPHAGPAAAPGPGAAQPAQNAVALQPGAPLNLRDVEQTLEALARLPSQAARFHIVPGTTEGGSVVVITPDGGPAWRASLVLESAESRTYGPLLHQANLTLDAPLGLSDQLAAVASWAGQGLGREAPQQSSFLVQHSLPWGRHLLSVNASLSQFRRRIVGGVGTFTERGVETQVQARWQTTAWRSADARLLLWAGATWQRTRADIDGTELLLRRRDSSRADLGASWFTQTGCGDLSVDAEAGHTLHMAHDEALQGPRQPKPSSWRMQATWQCNADTGVATGWQWAGRWWSQGSRHPSGSADLVLLGSQWTVRGHRPEAGLSGQGATVLRQELLSPAAAWGDRGAWRALLAVDHGRIHRPLQPDGLRQLSGVVLGLRWQWARFSGALTVAQAIGPRLATAPVRAGPLLYGSAGVGF